MSKFYIWRDETEEGPFTRTALLERMDAGELPVDTPAREATDQAWKPLIELLSPVEQQPLPAIPRLRIMVSIGIFLLVLWAGGVLTGCSDRAAEQHAAEVAQLRSEIASLRTEFKSFRTQTENLAHQQTNLTASLVEYATNDLATHSNLTAALWDIVDELDRLDARTNYVVLNARPAPLPTYQDYQRPAGRTAGRVPAPQSAAARKYGVPEEVYQIISKRAADRHPGDFGTQDYVIENEVESWKKLNPQ